jgi:hypothetical protein
MPALHQVGTRAFAAGLALAGALPVAEIVLVRGTRLWLRVTRGGSGRVRADGGRPTKRKDAKGC